MQSHRGAMKNARNEKLFCPSSDPRRPGTVLLLYVSHHNHRSNQCHPAPIRIHNQASDGRPFMQYICLLRLWIPHIGVTSFRFRSGLLGSDFAMHDGNGTSDYDFCWFFTLCTFSVLNDIQPPRVEIEPTCMQTNLARGTSASTSPAVVWLLRKQKKQFLSYG